MYGLLVSFFYRDAAEMPQHKPLTGFRRSLTLPETGVPTRVTGEGQWNAMELGQRRLIKKIVLHLR